MDDAVKSFWWDWTTKALAAIAVIVLFIVLVTGCSSTEPHIENHDGKKCMVRRNPFGKVTALSCEWNK